MLPVDRVGRADPVRLEPPSAAGDTAGREQSDLLKGSEVEGSGQGILRSAASNKP
jgi:hypothetical protein